MPIQKLFSEIVFLFYEFSRLQSMVEVKRELSSFQIRCCRTRMCDAKYFVGLIEVATHETIPKLLDGVSADRIFKKWVVMETMDTSHG